MDGVQTVPLAPQQAVDDAGVVLALEAPAVHLPCGDATKGQVVRDLRPTIRAAQVRPLQRVVAVGIRCVRDRQIPRRRHGHNVPGVALIRQPLREVGTGGGLARERQLLGQGVLDLLRRVPETLQRRSVVGQHIGRDGPRQRETLRGFGEACGRRDGLAHRRGALVAVGAGPDVLPAEGGAEAAVAAGHLVLDAEGQVAAVVEAHGPPLAAERAALLGERALQRLLDVHLLGRHRLPLADDRGPRRQRREHLLGQAVADDELNAVPRQVLRQRPDALHPEARAQGATLAVAPSDGPPSLDGLLEVRIRDAAVVRAVEVARVEDDDLRAPPVMREGLGDGRAHHGVVLQPEVVPRPPHHGARWASELHEAVLASVRNALPRGHRWACAL
mmetsp:Transcript_17363/g.48746  ORF Transcript_17363/g.48746 Transcript_17363/m.48746 type:complete len:388 (+) Transcript_17363:885-2048(+)